MEELLNGIDRLLDAPGFHARLVTDAQELHQLLTGSRGLYPKELPVQDQTGFDRAIDQAATNSKSLLDSLRANNSQAARTAISQLCKQRQAAHTRYSD